MNKAKLLLFGALVTVGLICAGLFIQRGNAAYDPKRVINTMPLNVDMQLSGINFTEVTQDQREWSLQADRLHYIKAENMVVLEKVKVILHAVDGPMQVSGEKGFYDREARMILLTGQVKANDSSGNNLTTNELRYDVQSQVLSAPGPFTLIGPKVDLKGHGLSVDTKDNRIKVIGRATLVIKSTNNLL